MPDHGALDLAARGSVHAWRVERLRDAGFPPALARTIAGSAGYDLHELLELTDRGCPAELAARITAPLGKPRERTL
jgi:hypothetical protein